MKNKLKTLSKEQIKIIKDTLAMRKGTTKISKSLTREIEQNIIAKVAFNKVREDLKI